MSESKCRGSASVGGSPKQPVDKRANCCKEGVVANICNITSYEAQASGRKRSNTKHTKRGMGWEGKLMERKLTWNDRREGRGRGNMSAKNDCSKDKWSKRNSRATHREDVETSSGQEPVKTILWRPCGWIGAGCKGKLDGATGGESKEKGKLGRHRIAVDNQYDPKAAHRSNDSHPPATNAKKSPACRCELSQRKDFHRTNNREHSHKDLDRKTSSWIWQEEHSTLKRKHGGNTRT
ncbi:hypothetical protein B0H16DRAFT_1458135 [Mycena metata]|uniref:Uncharacterized protein n=1 Tax=Mycena metata TaxID=1033252 RepID=A0AAD7J4E1_9AGAR|nr:hypothetical protein B0H16DRAFT_1458135 [Mycena metata]